MRQRSMEAYRRQQIEGLSPEELVLVAYEQGVLACKRKDRRRAIRVLEELIAALDFEYEQIAGRLLTLYDWALRQVREGNFDEARRILEGLRGTWAEALRRRKGEERAAPGRSDQARRSA